RRAGHPPPTRPGLLPLAPRRLTGSRGRHHGPPPGSVPRPSYHSAGPRAPVQSPGQQQARPAGATLQVWEEDPVDGPAVAAAFYPWPGKNLWKDNAAFYQHDLNLFAAPAGRDRPRGDMIYQAPVLATPVAAVADDVYTIIDPAN